MTDKISVKICSLKPEKRPKKRGRYTPRKDAKVARRAAKALKNLALKHLVLPLKVVR